MESKKRETGYRKKGRKKKAAIAVAVIAAVALCGGIAAAGRRSGGSQVPENVKQGTVERGDIHETVTGTGSLAADDTTEITAPVGIEVEKVFVKSGDTVREGDQIATVSELSVKEQLLDIQESIDSLQDEIDDLDPDSDNYALTKEVRQAELNDLVQTRSDMEKLRKTCVITADSDGIVDQVNIEDGEEITGSGISSSSSGSLDTSSIDLSSLLQGRLEDDCGTAAGIRPDTASSPAVSGTAVLTLTADGQQGSHAAKEGISDPDTSGSGNDPLQEKPADSGTGNGDSSSGTAGDTAGTGENTEAVSGQQTAPSGNSTGAQGGELPEDSLPASETGTRQITNSAADALPGADGADTLSQGGSSDGNSAVSSSDTGSSGSGSSAAGSTDLRTYTIAGESVTGIYGGPVVFHVEAPSAGAKPQSSVELPESMHCAAQIAWSPSDSAFQSGTAYTATVTITADDGYYFIDSVTDSSGRQVRALYVLADTCPDAVYTARDANSDGKTDTLTLVLPYAQTPSQQLTEDQIEALRTLVSQLAQSDLQKLKDNAGQISSEVAKAGVTSALKALEDAGISTGSLANLSKLADSGLSTLSTLSQLVSGGVSGLNTNSLSGLVSGLSGLNAGSLSGLSGLSGLSSLGGLSSLSADSLSGLTGSAASAGSSAYSSSRTAVVTLIPTQKMLLDIDVDEMDINSVRTGQTAQITLDAIDGKTFGGTITQVASTAENSGSGSVAKYKVSLELEKTQEMKFGMSATATIDVASRSDVLTIPIDALQSGESGDVVYTSVDRDGNLADPVSVETGLSTSETVEITSGLKDGDTFYYIPSNGGGSIIDQVREEQQESAGGTGNGEDDSSSGSGGQEQ